MTPRTLVLATLVTVMPLTAALGQSTPTLVDEYRITAWSGGDGITLGSIRSLVQTPDGFLWLASSAGLVRFDGVRFAAAELVAGEVQLPQVPTRAVSVARDGSIWVGYGDGEGVYHIKDGAVSGVHLRGRFPGFVNAILEDRASRIWVAHDDGLLRWQAGTWVAMTLPANDRSQLVNDVYQDRASRIWVTTGDGVYRSDDGDTFARLPHINGNARTLSEDAGGRIWTTDREFGFRLADASNVTPRFAGRGMSLLHDRQGHLWVATIGQGLWRVYDPTDAQSAVLQRLTVQAGLSTDEVGGLLEDREGNIWAGSIQGLNRLAPRKVRSLVDLGLVNAVAVDDQGIALAATTNGLLAMTGVTSRSAGTRQLLARGLFRTVHRARDGSVWAATETELSRLVTGRLRPARVGGRALDQVTSITSTSDGTVLVADARQGVVRFSGSTTGEHLNLPANAAVPHLVYMDSRDRLWMAFANLGVVVRDGEGHVRAYGMAEGLRHRVISVIAESREGDIWIGGSAGLSRLAGDRFETVTFSEPRVERPVVALAEDDRGDLWVGVQFFGIAHVTASELRRAAGDSSPLRYRLYNQTDGTAGWPDSSNNNGMSIAPDGTLWFVTGRGLTVLNPRELRASEDARPREPRIEGITADARRYAPAADTVLPPNTNNVRIDYTVVSMSPSDPTRFRYRLDGFDQVWIDGGSRRHAVYANLPPGRYRFRVQAMTQQGDWDTREARWAFDIEPAFYQTTSFILLFAATVLVLAGSAWQLRVRHLRRELAAVFTERMRVSRELHDTLLQSLVGVTLQLDALAQEVGPLTSQGAAAVVRMRRQLEEYVREARDSIWDLRSPQIQERGLVGALQETGERLTSGKMRFSLSVTGVPRPCPPAVERHVLRIAHEAIMNTVRHAGAHHLLVEIVFEASVLRLRIVDDGRGFNVAATSLDVHGHFGVRGMEERAEDVGGRFVIHSAPGAGVSVLAEFPLTT